MDIAAKSPEFRQCLWNLNCKLSTGRPYLTRAPTNYTSSFHHQAYVDKIYPWSNKRRPTSRSTSPVFPRIPYLTATRKPVAGVHQQVNPALPRNIRKTHRYDDVTDIKNQAAPSPESAIVEEVIEPEIRGQIPDELLNLSKKNSRQVRDDDCKSCPIMGQDFISCPKGNAPEKKAEVSPGLIKQQEKEGTADWIVRELAGVKNSPFRSGARNTNGGEEKSVLDEIRARAEPVLENVTANNGDGATDSSRFEEGRLRVSERVRVLEKFDMLNLKDTRESYIPEKLVKKPDVNCVPHSLGRGDGGTTKTAMITNSSAVRPLKMGGNGVTNANKRLTSLNSILIDSIKARIFSEVETKEGPENDMNDTVSWREIKFPKETQAAMQLFVSKNGEKKVPNHQEPRSLSSRQTPEKKKQSKRSHTKNCACSSCAQEVGYRVHLPCHKNLLCKKGLHAGRCSHLVHHQQGDESGKCAESRACFLAKNDHHRRDRFYENAVGDLDLLKIIPKTMKPRRVEVTY